MTRYAVTGAAGWLGAAAMAVLRARGAEVVGFANRPRDGLRALAELPELEHDVLLHFAFVTRELAAQQPWQDYVSSNVLITSRVCQAIANHQPSVFYASSGAAARPGGLQDDPYGALKRLDEHVLRDVSHGRCAVARVYNVAGPHVTKPGAFLLTDLVGQALRGGPVQLHSSRPVVRSYVDVEDVAAWAIAAAGQDVLVETAGAQELEATDVADEVARQLLPGTLVTRPAVSGAADRYVGDRQQWAAALGTAGIVERDFGEQVSRTIESVRALV